MGDTLGQIFTGLSLGSILLLTALGLAIIYGVMGVINMAHGELLMVGAYAAYFTQGLFPHWLPGLHRLVRGGRHPRGLPGLGHGGGRAGAQRDPLAVRPAPGDPAGHLGPVADPDSVGPVTVRRAERRGRQPDLDVRRRGDHGRLGAALEPHRHHRLQPVRAGPGVGAHAEDPSGHVRARRHPEPAMAGCVGVPTARIDTLAFGLGAGIAGLGGLALSQIANVGPDMGQGYIVDSFMVVVLGGVGQLAGAVWAALGLGVVTKFLEGWAGAVIAKIVVLVMLIVFIQKRPQGLFALKGRSVEN